MSDPHVSFSFASLTRSSQTANLVAAQSIMISCQASPVAERNRTKTAWKNDPKLLFRVIVVSVPASIFPNI